MATCSPDQARRLAEALRFPTVSPSPDVGPSEGALKPFDGLISFLERAFPLVRSHLRWERLGPLALLLSWESADGSRSSPAAPARRPVLLYAHLDVVPPGDEAGWTHHPFSGDVADGCIWGRGALDDKSGALSQLEAVESLLAEGFEPARTVHLALGCDEETLGQRGAVVIARTLAERGVRLEALFDEGMFITDGVVRFVGRPVALVGCAEKGYADVGIEVGGQAGHASMPGPRTSAGVLAAIVDRLERRPERPRLTPTVVSFLRGLAPHARAPLTWLLARPRLFAPAVLAALDRSPATAALLRTTRAVTILRAGHTANVLPESARAVVNVRVLHGDSLASVRDAIERVARPCVPQGFGLQVSVVCPDPGEPVPASSAHGLAWDAVAGAVGVAEPRAVVVPSVVVGATDSRRFTAVTDAIYRLRPLVLGTAELEQVHGADERVSLDNYGRMIAFYRALLARLAGADAR